jgi:hypothetical protein
MIYLCELGLCSLADEEIDGLPVKLTPGSGPKTSGGEVGRRSEEGRELTSDLDRGRDDAAEVKAWEHPALPSRLEIEEERK